MAGRSNLTAVAIKSAQPGDKLNDGAGLAFERTKGGG